MSDSNFDFELFDPRGRSEGSHSDRSAEQGEYRPRHPRKGLSSSGEYRPRHISETESSSTSPSPETEDGVDDFVVFNFDEARRRKQEREDILNAQLAAAENPRELAQRMANSQPRRRPQPPRQHTARPDPSVKRAADFAHKLSGYAAPLEPLNAHRGGASGNGGRGKSASSRPSGSRATSAPRGSSSGGNGGGKGKARGLFASLPPLGKTIVVASAIVLSLALVYYSVFGALLSGMNSLELTRRENTPAAGVADMELKSASGVTNILLLGIDDDGGSGSRSDTIMLASLDSRRGTIRLCSILRDCYVEIPGHKNNRINSAYAYGGAQLAVQTVESNFRVKIDHCVTIDMAALVDVVDAMGGVEIELTSAEANQVNLHSHCGLTTEAGLQLLNGKQAVTYAQIRKIDSDFMRTQRQRTLINAILGKMRSLGVGELLNVVEAVAPNVATDMSSSEIATLAIKALPALSNELGQMTIPADGEYSNATISGMSVLKLDLEANAKLLRSYLYEG